MAICRIVKVDGEEMTEDDVMRRLLTGRITENDYRAGVARRVVDHELTGLQREIAERFYCYGESVTEIALSRGVAPSCVSRALARARENLYRCLRAVFPQDGV